MKRFGIATACLLAASPALANGPAFDLIYDPADGSLWFDTNGGRFIHYVIKGGPFFEENHVNPLQPSQAGTFTSVDFQLAGTNLGSQFMPDPVTLGQVLPAGLNEAAWASSFVSDDGFPYNPAFYNPNLGVPIERFDLHYGWPEVRQQPYVGGPTIGTTQLRIAAQGLFDAEGQVLASSSKTMAIIDVDGDGLAGFDLANWTGDSFLPDPDDVLVSDGIQGLWYEATGDGDFWEDYAPDEIENSVIDSSQDGYYQIEVVNAANNDATRVGEGDRVYLFYFPDLPIDAEAPGAFQSFGVFEAGSMSGPGEFTDLRTVFADSVYLADNQTGEGVQALYMTVLALPGDADGDGDIDDADLGTAFTNYTGPGGGGQLPSDGDTDGDGDVDDADLGTAISNYTGPLAPASVPEPTSMVLIALGGLAIVRRRRA